MLRKTIFLIVIYLSAGLYLFLLTSCEGPEGEPGKDANESCKTCHNPNIVDRIIPQYELSKHFMGTSAFDERGTVACAPCHESSGFNFVCANNIPSTFTLDPATNKYVNNYMTPDTAAYGSISCRTCHSSIHKTYDSTDLRQFATTMPVKMTMWAEAKTIDITQNNSKSNLCIKCHQPRPIAASASLSDGNVVDYADLAANPLAVFYDSASSNIKSNKLLPTYRTSIHYGSSGAIFAGKGGIEFAGSMEYTSSKHAITASCIDCHMGAMTGAAGGHTFSAKGNFKSCNVVGCHSDEPYSATTPKFINTQKEIKGLLEILAAKITSGSGSLLHSDINATTNLWAGVTVNNYDGYLNIYDPIANPGGTFQCPAPAGSWLPGQKILNKALPKFTSLKNVQFGAIINFQLCLREFSLGIHNYEYSKALLTNTIDALTAAGF